SEGTVRTWLRRVTHDGIAQLLGRSKPPPRRLDADPSPLRALAAKERDPRVRKRMLALACMAEGMGFYYAEGRSGLNREMFKERLERFQREGAGAFRDGKDFGRPKKLSRAGLRRLCRKVLANPKMTVQEVSDWLHSQLGVPYSINGIRRLLKDEFGIVRVRVG